MKTTLVVTTINAPNDVLHALSEGAAAESTDFIIVGDKKTPTDFAMSGVRYLSPDAQGELFPQLSEATPWNHYARKNIGYLAALASGSDWLLETDDDNYPIDNFFKQPATIADVRTVHSDSAWLNVYDCFNPDKDIWPRGYPLELLEQRHKAPVKYGKEKMVKPCLVQGLANENPDVDAVFRLTRQLPVEFDKSIKPIKLSSGNWCPFNSQNTWIRRDVSALAYLPSFCSFRMTDIWRSFIAQRCLWEQNEGVVFVAPTVRQERNEHNLLKDFEDEVSGYVNNARIASLLENVALSGSYSHDMVRCYEVLVEEGIFPTQELSLLKSWIGEIESIL